MIRAYIGEAMRRAHYEIIEDEEPYYGEVSECPGLWATGKTLEKCRQNLEDALDDWLYIHIAKGIPIPPVGEVEIKPLEAMTE